MTREEAWRRTKGYLYDALSGEEADEIIKALEQESCEDTISREAVLEKAVYTETEEGWCGYTVDVDYIKSLPSVKPQLICEEREKGECPYYAG